MKRFGKDIKTKQNTVPTESTYSWEKVFRNNVLVVPSCVQNIIATLPSFSNIETQIHTILMIIYIIPLGNELFRLSWPSLFTISARN